MQTRIYSNSKMDARDHSNGVIPKNHRSRGNFKYYFFIIAILFICGNPIIAQIKEQEQSETFVRKKTSNNCKCGWSIRSGVNITGMEDVIKKIVDKYCLFLKEKGEDGEIIVSFGWRTKRWQTNYFYDSWENCYINKGGIDNEDDIYIMKYCDIDIYKSGSSYYTLKNNYLEYKRKKMSGEDIKKKIEENMSDDLSRHFTGRAFDISPESVSYPKKLEEIVKSYGYEFVREPKEGPIKCYHVQF